MITITSEGVICDGKCIEEKCLRKMCTKLVFLVTEFVAWFTWFTWCCLEVYASQSWWSTAFVK